MADLSDPDIGAAYNDIRDDKNDKKWMQIAFVDEKSNKLFVQNTGSGSINEAKEKLSEDSACFLFARIKFSNDKESFREKFVLVTWIGQNVKIMRRARLSVQKADVAQVLRGYAIEIPASTPEDVDEDTIIGQLRKVGGANYGPGK